MRKNYRCKTRWKKKRNNRNPRNPSRSMTSSERAKRHDRFMTHREQSCRKSWHQDRDQSPILNKIRGCRPVQHHLQLPRHFHWRDKCIPSLLWLEFRITIFLRQINQVYNFKLEQVTSNLKKIWRHPDQPVVTCKEWERSDKHTRAHTSRALHQEQTTGWTAPTNPQGKTSCK